MEHAWQNMLERKRMLQNATKDAAAYSQQFFSQGDPDAPHLQPFGLPAVPSVQLDLRLHPELSSVRTQRSAAQMQSEGGALSKADVQHFLTVRVNKLNQALASAKERGVEISRPQSSAQTTAENARLGAQTLSLQETLAALQRILESGIASTKLLERSQDVLEGVARLAAKMTPEESASLRQEIEDAADEAEAQYSELTPEDARSKQGKVKEATAKLLRDAIRVLESGRTGPNPQDRAARVQEARREAARRPGADSKRRRTEIRQAEEAERARLAQIEADALFAAEADLERARLAEARAARAEIAQEAADAAREVRSPIVIGEDEEEDEDEDDAPRRRLRLRPASPALTRARAARANAARDLAQAQARAERSRARSFSVPAQLPAIGTDLYRALVRFAHHEPRVAALKQVARAYDMDLTRFGRTPTKAALYAYLIAQ